MSLQPGTKLGPYEVIAPIGAGGMGEVFRARDARLGRDVAIKVLPASFASDTDRLRRFEQEARAAGALNHPNITAVHDIGAHDGAPYIVEELLEGETLRAALAGGRLPVRRAVDHAVQIARGLAAAHEKGIVHRDLKPENVFVTRDGRIKILDFGLARVVQRETKDVTGLPTETHGTDPGTVMGTLGYMSPEQVRGQNADARSDLFAFGAILYEMLAGQRAFKGESAADTISAILREEPPDLSVTNKSIPPGLERILRHCLEKSPEQRFQSARDVAFDLEALSTTTSGTPFPTGVSISSRRVPMVAAVAATLLALALGVLAGAALLGRRADPPRFTALTFRRGLVRSARFGPDGRTIVYGASHNGGPFQLFSTRAEAVDSRPLGIEADLLSVSREGDLALSLGRRFTLGWESAGTLARMPLDGGAPRELLENVQEADWSPDGRTLLVVRESGAKYRLEYPIGKTLFETEGWISLARLSPRGDRIAFIDHPQRGDNIGALRVLDLSGRATTWAPRGGQGLAWSPDGREVWASTGGTLYAQSGPGKRRVLARVPSGAWLLDVAPDGSSLMAQADIRREIGWAGPRGEPERNLSWLNWSYPGDLSPDGKVLLFEESNIVSEAGSAVFLRKTDGSAAVQIGEGAAIALSPDGKWALSVLRPFGEKTQLVLLPTGAGQPTMLPEDGIRYSRWGTFLPDGKGVVIAGTEKNKGLRIWRRALDGSPARPVTPEGIRPRFSLGALSPDGALLVSTDPQDRLVIYPLAGGEARLLAGALPGETPLRWSGASSILLASTTREIPVKITRLDVSTGKRELVRELAPSDPSGIFSMDPILATADGSAFATSYRRLLSTLYLVEGLK